MSVLLQQTAPARLQRPRNPVPSPRPRLGSRPQWRPNGFRSHARKHVALVEMRRRTRTEHDVPKPPAQHASGQDRKSTRLNSSHVAISYAVFCLKKKKRKDDEFISDVSGTEGQVQ